LPSDAELVEILEKAGKKPEEIEEILKKDVPPPPKDDDLDTIIYEARGSSVVRIRKGAEGGTDGSSE
jgi:hypothetical protein